MKVIEKFKGTRLVPFGEDLINFVLETSKNGFNPELSKGFVKELLEADAKNTAIPKLKLNFSVRDYFASKQNWTELLTKKNFDFEKAEKLVKLVTKSDPEAVFSKLIPELILTSGEKFAQFVAKVGKYNEIAEKHEINPLNFLECSVENFEMSEKTLLKKLEEIEKLAEAHPAYFNEISRRFLNRCMANSSDTTYLNTKNLPNFLKR